ncbi:MAG: DUF4147 domain-containing protein [Planctomycetota bacterium]|nr:DUF4147 domain-containing protein [Planctomycetota bacterium]
MIDRSALLRSVYEGALTHLRARLDEYIPARLTELLEDIMPGGRVLLVAFGKASRPMATRALEALAAAPVEVAGLLVPANDDTAALPPLEVIAGGHPLPTAGSFDAGRRALQLVSSAGPMDTVVFLVSGGGSALLESPIDPGATVEEWRRLQRALIGSGASIERINAVRMRLSAIKGGRLAAAASRAGAVHTLFVSDVSGGVETISSGPSARCGARDDTLRRDLDELDLWHALPRDLAERAARGEIPALPADSDIPGSYTTIADETDCRCYTAEALRAAGVFVDASMDLDDLPVDAAVDRAVDRLDALRAGNPRRDVAIVTTGELSVPLPEQPGIGGRNLQFALRCAEQIAGRAVTALSCGTDGIDGCAPAAGAIVDGDTARLAQQAGLDVLDHLRRFDAYPLLARVGCAIAPGPTGMNVRDLRVLLAAGA